MPSLPLWERGLKFFAISSFLSFFTSLPLWERGLKSFEKLQLYAYVLVAPFVGAWIEMRQLWQAVFTHKRSLPLWERGLKYCYPAFTSIILPVAPVVGAWIEIRVGGKISTGRISSLPLWERGLKSRETFYEDTVTGRSLCGSVD